MYDDVRTLVVHFYKINIFSSSRCKFDKSTLGTRRRLRQWSSNEYTDVYYNTRADGAKMALVTHKRVTSRSNRFYWDLCSGGKGRMENTREKRKTKWKSNPMPIHFLAHRHFFGPIFFFSRFLSHRLLSIVLELCNNKLLEPRAFKVEVLLDFFF